MELLGKLDKDGRYLLWFIYFYCCFIAGIVAAHIVEIEAEPKEIIVETFWRA